MIHFYLDTEFSGHGGWLISLALVVNKDDYLYLVQPGEDTVMRHEEEPMDPWVVKNVMPVLFDNPPHMRERILPVAKWGAAISEFIYGREEPPQIVADWPEDIRYLMELLITGPGEAVPMEGQTHFTVIRHVDIYPTTLEGAVQHNALWDALAIREYLINK